MPQAAPPDKSHSLKVSEMTNWSNLSARAKLAVAAGLNLSPEVVEALNLLQYS